MPGVNTGIGVSSACSVCAPITYSSKASTKDAASALTDTNPIGECGLIQLDTRAGIDLTLPIQRRTVAVLGNHHVSQQPRTCVAALDRPRPCTRLHETLAARAGCRCTAQATSCVCACGRLEGDRQTHTENTPVSELNTHLSEFTHALVKRCQRTLAAATSIRSTAYPSIAAGTPQANRISSYQVARGAYLRSRPIISKQNIVKRVELSNH